MTNEEKYYQFEAYLDNSMSLDEKESFETLLEQHDFKTDFEEYVSIQNEYKKIIENESKENEFITNLKRIATATQTSNSIASSTEVIHQKFAVTRNLKWVASIAAIFIIGFVGYQIMHTQKSSMSKMYATNYFPEKLSVERGSADVLFDSLTVLYNSEQYAQALPGLIDYRDNYHQENNNINLAIAICQLELKDYVSAENNLQNLIAQNDVYKEKAQWYLAMLYLKQENKSKAIDLLSDFKESHFYYNKATTILKDLK